MFFCETRTQTSATRRPKRHEYTRDAIGGSLQGRVRRLRETAAISKRETPGWLQNDRQHHDVKNGCAPNHRNATEASKVAAAENAGWPLVFQKRHRARRNTQGAHVS